jgi:hypothetical protein
MDKKICTPKTFISHPSQRELRTLLQDLFVDPDPEHITEEIVNFLQKNPIPVDDFPLYQGTYTRTILFRNDNGFEAMAARWSKGALSSIHGHPSFTLYFVVKGQLELENYKKNGDKVEPDKSGILSESQFNSFTGPANTFNNHIHQVQAIEETLSIHISSDDATKGEIFSRAR